jgi:hypothetical protein
MTSHTRVGSCDQSTSHRQQRYKPWNSQASVKGKNYIECHCSRYYKIEKPQESESRDGSEMAVIPVTLMRKIDSRSVKQRVARAHANGRRREVICSFVKVRESSTSQCSPLRL